MAESGVSDDGKSTDGTGLPVVSANDLLSDGATGDGAGAYPVIPASNPQQLSELYFRGDTGESNADSGSGPLTLPDPVGERDTLLRSAIQQFAANIDQDTPSAEPFQFQLNDFPDVPDFLPNRVTDRGFREFNIQLNIPQAADDSDSISFFKLLLEGDEGNGVQFGQGSGIDRGELAGPGENVTRFGSAIVQEQPKPLNDELFDSYLDGIDDGSLDEDDINSGVADASQRNVLLSQLSARRRLKSDTEDLDAFRAQSERAVRGLRLDADNAARLSQDRQEIIESAVLDNREIRTTRQQAGVFVTEAELIVLSNDTEVRTPIIGAGFADDIRRLREKRQDLFDRTDTQRRTLTAYQDVLDGNITDLYTGDKEMNNDDIDAINSLIRNLKTAPDALLNAIRYDYTIEFSDSLDFVRTLPVTTSAEVAERRRLEGIVLAARDQYQKFEAAVAVLDALTENDFEATREALNTVIALSGSKEQFSTVSAEIASWEFELDRIAVYDALAQTQLNFGPVDDALRSLRRRCATEELRQRYLALEQQISVFERRAFRESVRQQYSTSDFDAEKVIKTIDKYKPKTPQDIDEFIQLKQEVRDIAGQTERIMIRELFTNAGATAVLARIAALPAVNDEDRQRKRDLFNGYREFVRIRGRRRPQDAEVVNAVSVSEFFRRTEELSPMPDLGINKRAFEFARKLYVRNLFPIVESFRSIRGYKEKMDSVVPRGLVKGGINPRVEYMLRLRDLAQQRDLTDTERLYIQSVELLSVYAPYLVGLARTDFGSTSVLMQQHFESVSRKTKERLQNEVYVPALVIGAGVHGIAAMSELVRQRPDIADGALVVDSGTNPGGPFAWVMGKGWLLNSANARRSPIRVLPDKPAGDEAKTVRAWGNPTGWYAGERSEASPDARLGDINTVVPFGAKAGDITPDRYATNENLQVTIALNAALCVKNIAFQTKVLEVIPVSDGRPGNKYVRLQITDAVTGDVREVTIRTDIIIASTGLGTEYYGFDLEGKRAEGIIADGEGYDGMKKLGSTKDAFAVIGDRTVGKRVTMGGTVAIYGSGNSKDTLIENIVGIFASGDMEMGKVKKIYIISNEKGGERPRYGLIKDVEERLGRKNIVEFVQARVDDVSYTPGSRSKSYEERTMYLIDRDGNRIRNDRGDAIVADHVIAATGFKSEIDGVFDAYFPGDSLYNSRAVTTLALPSNPDVAVGLRFREDPNIIIVGTASPDGFNAEKFAQLPALSSSALRRVGAANAVAIAFRQQDTLAAVNILVRKFGIPVREMTPDSSLDIVPVTYPDENEGETTDFSLSANEDIDYNSFLISDLKIQDNANPRVVLSALTGTLLQSMDVRKDDNTPFFGRLSFDVSVDDEGYMQFEFTGGSRLEGTEKVENGREREITTGIKKLTSSFLLRMTALLKDSYFQRYMLYELANSRGPDRKVRMELGFTRGRIDPHKSYVYGNGF